VLRTQVTSLRAANESLRALLEDKDAKITELEAKLARLERLISRNSGDSSMPPSGDDQPGKTPPKQKPGRGAGKRKPGKQPGAPGACLAWNDHPDRTGNLFPEGNCGCGTDLKDAADLGVVISHQVSDLPGEVRAQTVQYDRHEAVCSCGRPHVAGAPPQAPGTAPGTVTYGVNFQAWCVFLMVMHHVPAGRCADIIEPVAGTRPSDGWVHSLLARAAGAVAAADTTIRALILLARVICGDETPLRAGPGPRAKKKYLQVACTSDTGQLAGQPRPPPGDQPWPGPAGHALPLVARHEPGAGCGSAGTGACFRRPSAGQRRPRRRAHGRGCAPALRPPGAAGGPDP